MVSPKNGSVVITSGLGGDISGFDLSVSQTVDNSTSYADVHAATHHGSGCAVYAGTIMGFLNDAPGLGTTSSAEAAALDPAGNAVVFTVDTGCTYTGDFVFESVSFSHRKLSGVVPFSARCFGTGPVAEAWAA